MRKPDDTTLDTATHPTTPWTGEGEDELCLLALTPGATSVYPLVPSRRYVLGRSSSCDVVLQDPSVSRRHAAIERDVTIRVTDLESANGVKIAGQRVPPGATVEVRPGQTIEMGRVLLMVRPRALARDVGALSDRRPRRGTASERGAVVIEHPATRDVYRLIDRVASSNLNVLLLGETGVGKDLAAEALHKRSRRASKPFVRVNCAALPPSLAESELFGHARGAFTGADQARAGVIEAADGGTLFLDEIGELPLELQAKLLRVLEDRTVTRLGATTPRTVDVRFVAATHRDLAASVASGRFRQDLYFRLDGVSIVIPPLRERATEIPQLATRFAARIAAAEGYARAPHIAAAAMDRLRRHAWPGNVRELRNVIERAVVLAGGEDVTVEHLPSSLRPEADRDERPQIRGADVAVGLREQMAALERGRIVDALARCSGNQTRAAKMLDMPRRTLVKRLVAYGIERPRATKT